MMSATIFAYKRCSVRLYLQLAVGGHISYLCYLCLFVCVVMSNIYCVVFWFWLSSFCVPMLPVSLNYQYLIAPTVFSNVYL